MPLDTTSTLFDDPIQEEARQKLCEAIDDPKVKVDDVLYMVEHNFPAMDIHLVGWSLVDRVMYNYARRPEKDVAQLIEKLAWKGAGIESSLLHQAIEKNQPEVVEALLRTGQVDVKENNELIHAIQKGNVRIVGDLLQAGTPVDVTGEGKRGPLHEAALRCTPANQNETAEITHLLLNKGANPNVKDSWRNLPLHYAVAKNGELVQILMAGGTQLFEKNRSGKEVPVENAAGSTPLQSLIYAGMLQAEDPNEYAKTAKYLLYRIKDPSQHNALLNHRNYDGDTALKMAVRNIPLIGQEGVATLLTEGADPNIPDKEGNTALHQAIGEPEAVKTLLASHADWRLLNKKHQTPRQAAAAAIEKEISEIIEEEPAYIEENFAAEKYQLDSWRASIALLEKQENNDHNPSKDASERPGSRQPIDQKATPSPSVSMRRALEQYHAEQAQPPAAEKPQLMALKPAAAPSSEDRAEQIHRS